MATEVVKIVDPDNGSGTHYTSLAAWESGEERDLVTADEIAVAKCRCTNGSADTSWVEVGGSGWVTDSTRYIKIWADPSETYYHKGKLDNTKYRLSVSRGYYAGLWIYPNYTQIIGLQVKNSANMGIRLSGNSQLVANTIIYESAGDGIYFSSGPNTIIVNCISLRNSGYGYYSYPQGTSPRNRYLYNCLSIGNSYGIRVIGWTTAYVKNCYFGNNSTADYSVDDVSYLYLTTSYSSDGSQSTPTAAYSSSTGAKFTSVTPGYEDFHLQSGSALIDVGTDLSSDSIYPFNYDIDGETRSGTWDIGADEYVSAGGSALPVFMRTYRARRL